MEDVRGVAEIRAAARAEIVVRRREVAAGAATAVSGMLGRAHAGPAGSVKTRRSGLACPRSSSRPIQASNALRLGPQHRASE